MTKHDLSVAVAKRYPQYSVREAKVMVNTVFTSMATALARGEHIELRGFGSFEVRKHRAHKGRNPRTGAVIAVAAKRMPFFKVGKELRLRVDDTVYRLSRLCSLSRRINSSGRIICTP